MLLIAVQNAPSYRPTATARKHGPLRGRADRQICDFSRATPSFPHAPGDTSSSRLSHSNNSCHKFVMLELSSQVYYLSQCSNRRSGVASDSVYAAFSLVKTTAIKGRAVAHTCRA
jgi:hypothetical protein